MSTHQITMVKASFNLPVTELEIVKQEASERGITVTQVIREAMADHKFLMAESAKGSTFLLREADGSEGKVIMHR